MMLNRTRPIEPRIIYEIETSRYNRIRLIESRKSFTMLIQNTIGLDQ